MLLCPRCKKIVVENYKDISPNDKYIQCPYCGFQFLNFMYKDNGEEDGRYRE